MFSIYLNGEFVLTTTLEVWKEVDFRLTWAPGLKLRMGDCPFRSTPPVYQVEQANSMLFEAIGGK